MQRIRIRAHWADADFAPGYTAPVFSILHESMPGHSVKTPIPTAITVHGRTRVLAVAFEDGAEFRIPFELLRVCSPSAEVQGHGPGQEVLQTGKRDVLIEAVEPVGHYGVQPRFSDGHASGIYTWEYLYFLGARQDEVWREHEAKLRAAGIDRDAPQARPADPGCSPSH